MAVDFFFDPPTVDIPALGQLRGKWVGISDLTVREMIVQEEQYLCFHRALLDKVCSTAAGELQNPPWQLHLDISLRAGAVKAAALMCGSIAEAALRTHAERRGLPLPPVSRHRTFGKVMAAWESGGAPDPAVTAIWDDLRKLHEVRNNVHLFAAAESGSADFASVLAEERDILAAGERAIEHLAALRSP